MPYFTSWDANVFLCLLTILPLEVVRGMIKMLKKEHEHFVETEARKFHSNLSKDCCGKHDVLMDEFRMAWMWKSPEIRRDFIDRWIRKSSYYDLDRLKYDCNPLNGRYRIDCDEDIPKNGRLHSSLGLWSIWETWCHDEMDRQKDYDLIRIIKRKNTICEWYSGIHEGRYFLFFRENNIKKCKCKLKNVFDNYRMKVLKFTSISEYAPFEQFAEDLQF